jgi:hypothetical protein
VKNLLDDVEILFRMLRRAFIVFYHDIRCRQSLDINQDSKEHPKKLRLGCFSPKNKYSIAASL